MKKILINAIFLPIAIHSSYREENVPLLKAIQNGDYNTVSLYIARGGDPNANILGYQTPLIASIINNTDAITRRLLQSPTILIDGKKSDNVTPLMIALEYSRESTMLALLEKGANPNAKTSTGKTVLQYAISKTLYWQPIVAKTKLLMEYGALPTKEDMAHLLSVIDYQEIQPAIQEEVLLYLEKGASVDTTNTKNNDTILHLIMHTDAENQEEMIPFIKKILTFNPNLSLPNHQGKTAFHEAVLRNKSLFIRQLISARPELLSMKNHQGLTPFQMLLDKIEKKLIKSGDYLFEVALRPRETIDFDYETAQLLIRAGADINEESYKGNTIVSLAARDGKTAFLKKLLSSDKKRSIALPMAVD